MTDISDQPPQKPNLPVKVAANLPAALPQTVTISSYATGFWRRKLRATIEALPVEDEAARLDPDDDNFKIPRAEWDATLGPVFARAAADLITRPDNRAVLYCAATAYNAMHNEDRGDFRFSQHQAFHMLVQCFAAARDPAYLQSFRRLSGAGKTENPHRARLQLFADTLHGQDKVLVTRTQLNAIANIAKAGADYALHERRAGESEALDERRAFYTSQLRNNPKISYR